MDDLPARLCAAWRGGLWPAVHTVRPAWHGGLWPIVHTARPRSNPTAGCHRPRRANELVRLFSLSLSLRAYRRGSRKRRACVCKRIARLLLAPWAAPFPVIGLQTEPPTPTPGSPALALHPANGGAAASVAAAVLSACAVTPFSRRWGCSFGGGAGARAGRLYS
eukprot:351243-Chlamydomonas_euryale.AAC.6